MPYLGSRGATKTQIEERLGFTTYEDYVGAVFQLIHNSVNNPGKKSSAEVSLDIFLDIGCNFNNATVHLYHV